MKISSSRICKNNNNCHNNKIKAKRLLNIWENSIAKLHGDHTLTIYLRIKAIIGYFL